MLRLWEMVRGRARLRLRGVERARLLERCREAGLRLEKLEAEDALTLRLELRAEQLPRLRQIAEGLGFETELLSQRGGREGLRRLGRRWALAAGLTGMLALLLVSQLFIWQIRVQGCESLSRGQVLRALAACGVEPGTFAPAVRQELVRSQMLTELPALEWMTVNISGSRATVLVRERREKPEIAGEGPREIRAARAGIIRSMTVLEGVALAQPGDAVLPGELLVSGVAESLSAPPRLVQARAEIRAETWRELVAVCPVEMLQTRQKGTAERSFALLFGKKLLPLGKNWGKGLDECDKIVHEYTLGVEGLFSLPLSLRQSVQRPRLPDGGAAERSEEMKRALLQRLETEIDGEVLDTSFSAGYTDGLLTVTLQAHCCENIALEITP